MKSPVEFLSALSVGPELIQKLGSLPFSNTGTRRLCLHESESSPLHVMLVESKAGVAFPAHFHSDGDEVTMIIGGRLSIEIWDKGISQKPTTLTLGTGPADAKVLFTPKGTAHTTCAVETNCTYLEVKQGPFNKLALVSIAAEQLTR